MQKMFKFNNYIAIFGNTIFSFFWSPLQIAAYMDRQPSWIYLILIHLLPHMALYNLRCYLELLAVPPPPLPPSPEGLRSPGGQPRSWEKWPRAPQYPGPQDMGSRWALGPVGPGHGSPLGPLGARRKKPQTPRHLGAFRGRPSGGSG